MRSLDKALATFHVERQAYHGGSFIGNHVHRCLKVKNYHAVVLATELCGELVPQAEYIGDRFERALLLFRQCHVVYNSAEHVSQLHCLGTAITKFMAYYRSTFPTATVLPKMHFLEDHAVNFIKKWGTGFGFPTKLTSFSTWFGSITFVSAPRTFKKHPAKSRGRRRSSLLWLGSDE